MGYRSSQALSENERLDEPPILFSVNDSHGRPWDIPRFPTGTEKNFAAPPSSNILHESSYTCTRSLLLVDGSP